MKSWAYPEIDTNIQLSGNLIILDTVSGNQFHPIADSKMRIYVCGITPYDSAHIGHLFTYLTFDILIRSALKLGANVTYVQNITDIDDPLFERARKVNRGWREIADEQIENFRVAMEYLRIIPPNYFAAVTEEMPNIISASESMNESLYKLDSNTYFSTNVTDLLDFTKMNVAELERIAAERGGDPEKIGKKNPLDPKVWVSSAPDEPIWDSSFGRGRPGWHVECVAIANKYLESTFDVQGGGKDLLFPHHAFCDQLNNAINQEPLARGYLHVELVEYEGDKMSKSLGNLVFLKDLTHTGFSADEIRLGLAMKDWRTPWEFSMKVIEDGRNLLLKWTEKIDLGEFTELAVLEEHARNTLFDGLNINGFVDGILHLPMKNLPSEDIQQALNLLNDLLGLKLEIGKK